MTTWSKHVANWKDCQLCPLGTQRGRICLARACKGGDPPGFYGGSLPCEVLFIGEAPGQSEDAMGLPFVGPAGDLLDQIRIRALPKDVPCAFTNLVACYPRDAKATDNHQPERGEILECRWRLVEFVNLSQPRLIVRVGSLVQSYFNFNTTVPFTDIVHPAYILSNNMPAAQKRFAIDKCIVQITKGYETVVSQPPKPFQEWTDAKEAKPTSKRKQLEQIYRPLYDISGTPPGEDDIPF